MKPGFFFYYFWTFTNSKEFLPARYIIKAETTVLLKLLVYLCSRHCTDCVPQEQKPHTHNPSPGSRFLIHLNPNTRQPNSHCCWQFCIIQHNSPIIWCLNKVYFNRENRADYSTRQTRSNFTWIWSYCSVQGRQHYYRIMFHSLNQRDKFMPRFHYLNKHSTKSRKRKSKSIKSKKMLHCLLALYILS